MKKRILSIVLSICMVLSFVPVMPITASAEGTCNCPAKCTDSYKDPDCPVCNSGGNCESRRNRRIYDDGMGITTQFHLQAALDWKDAAHYLYYFPLDADITVSSNITVPGNADFVLDLNGHTLSGGDKWAIFKVYGKLTIIDTKGGGKLVDAQGAIKIAGGYVLMKGGTIENCTISGGALVQSGGTFKMTGGTLKNNKAYVGFWLNAEEYPASICCDSGGGTVVIDGDAQVLCCDQDNCSHFGAVCKVTTLYADGGKIKGGIYNEFISDSGIVTGTITSHHAGIGEGTLIEGKILNYGTVSGGTYLGEVENIGGGIISGGSFAGKVTNTASISGGTFNSEVDNQGTVSGGSFAGKVTSTGSISGGTFNSEVVNQDTISGGMYSETGVVKNSGTVSGGTFLGTVETENGTIEDRAKVSANFVNEDGETMKTVRVLRGQRITSADLPEFDPTQYGYKKLKYSVGNTDYRDEDKFINEVRFTEDETRVTVTRIFPIAYTITCILNNGQQDRTYTYTVTDPDFTLHNPTKDGYVFTGWGGTGLEGTSNMTVTIPKGSIGDREYTAYYWKNIGGDLISPDYSYTVVYDTKGGSPVEPKTVPKLLASAEKVLDGADTIRAGYRFTGWYCGNKRIALQDTTVKDLADRADNGVITITAHWREKLEVSFNTATQECTYDGTEKAFDIKDTTLDGFQVTYRKNGNTVTAPVNAGSYDVIVTREEDQNYKAANVTIPGGLVIKPKEVIVTISEISDRIYTGNYIKPAIKVSDGTNEIPASEYTVDYANNINAGTATVTVTAKAGGNYTFSQITKNFTIKKKTISPAVTMADYVYGTYPDSPVISGNEGGGAARVYYSTYDDIADNPAHRLLWNVDAIDGTMLEAGTYYIMAEVEETQNYTAGISPVITFRVLTNQYAAPTAPALSGSTVTVSEADRSKALEYSLNGGDWVDVPTLNNGSFVLSGLADNTGYTLSLRVKAGADGNHAASDAVSSFFVAYNANGGTGTVPSGASVSGGNPVTVAAGDQLRRDGYTFGGWNTEADGTGTAYAAESAITAGATLYAQWTVNRYTVTFNTNGGNETISDKTGVKWTDKVLDGITAPTKDGWKFIGWKYGDVTVTPQTTYKELAADATVTSIELKAQWEDITAPTGEITIGTNSWKAFLNKITFGLFFKDTKTVTITASDNSGDEVTVSYLLSNKALTADDLAVKEFIAYTGGFDIEPNNEWIIYVMLTDEAGNVTYLSSDGIVLDNVAPVISGVENGKTYCGAQTVTVDEKYIDSVTVNGKEITLQNNQFTLPAAEGTQKIVATDKAGNVSAEITVTVNDGYTDENKVHKCDICGANMGVHEDKNQDHKCDICGATLSEHTGGIVTCTEKAVCEYCHKPYGEPKGHNYKETVVQPTDFTLGATQHKCDNCGDEFWVDFKTKENYSQTEMPNGETITHYITHHGSEAEKNVDIENPVVSAFKKDPSGTLKRMEDDGIKIYTITKGAEQTVPSNAEKIVFRSDAPFDEFYQVMINGLVLDKKYYSVKKGSTIVTLNEDFVKEIPTGMHLFGIISKDGVAITTFTVDDKAAADNDTNSPQTGDNSYMALWIALLFVSGAVVIGTTGYGKKKREE